MRKKEKKIIKELIIIIKLFRELTIKLTVIELIKTKVFFGIRLNKNFWSDNARSCMYVYV